VYDFKFCVKECPTGFEFDAVEFTCSIKKDASNSKLYKVIDYDFGKVPQGTAIDSAYTNAGSESGATLSFTKAAASDQTFIPSKYRGMFFNGSITDATVTHLSFTGIISHTVSFHFWVLRLTDNEVHTLYTKS
jgi:hypothetical protein